MITRRLAGLAFILLGFANLAVADTVTGSGTGFLINDAGWYVTNAHVIDGCTRISVGGLGDVVERKVDRVGDLAAVRVAKAPATQPLSFRKAPPRLGEDVAAFGYPLADVLSDSVKFTMGNINSVVGIGNDTRYLQISAPVQAGNSGGPLVDRTGNLLGVVSSQLGSKYARETGVQAQNVNFAIRTGVLEVFLQSYGIAYLAGEAQTEKLDTADLAEQVAPSVVQILCHVDAGNSVAMQGQEPAALPAATSFASIEEEAVALVKSLNFALSLSNDAALKMIGRFYSGELNYFGKPTSAAQVMADKNAFFRRWPMRYYSVRDDAAASCNGSICTITGSIDWFARSRPRKKASNGRATFVYTIDMGTQRIIGESSAVMKGVKAEIASYISLWHDYHTSCRGSYGPATEETCAKRDLLSDIIETAGMCYGRQNEAGYQYTWHICAPGSNGWD